MPTKPVGQRPLTRGPGEQGERLVGVGWSVPTALSNVSPMLFLYSRYDRRLVVGHSACHVPATSNSRSEWTILFTSPSHTTARTEVPSLPAGLGV